MAGAAEDDESDPDEHDNIIGGATTSVRTTTLVSSFVTRLSTRGDENAAIAVRELLALHESNFWSPRLIASG